MTKEQKLLLFGLGVGLLFTFMPRRAKNAAQNVATTLMDIPTEPISAAINVYRAVNGALGNAR